MGKVYYLVPDLFVPNLNPIKILSNIKKKGLRKGLASIFPKHKPVGGTKVTYQHCMLLREMGIDASIVLMGKYKGNFFGYDTQYLTKKQALSKISSEDIVVGTEFRPFEALCFDKAKKVLFFQNPANISRVLKKEGPKKNYLELGYDYVITCGDLCTEVLKNEMGIDATTITNGVDQSIFKPAKETKIVGRVLVMSRKNFQDFEKIRNICSKKLDVDFHIVDGLTQEQLIKEYQKSDIFLATGYPEGFGLPPLEAMLCGCAVVGFTGGAAGEYMIDEDTALVADDGDCETAADKLLHILTDENLKESIRKNGTAKAKEYSLERTSYLLRQFYKDVIE